jgi:hypothetical protein
VKSQLLAMPFFLRIIVALGFVAPFVTLISLLSGDIEQRYMQEVGGVSMAPSSIALIVLCTVPLFISSVMFIQRKNVGKLWCVLGHFLTNVSPIVISLEIAKSDIFVLEFSFYLILITLITGYLFRNSEVRNYFSKKYEPDVG